MSTDGSSDNGPLLTVEQLAERELIGSSEVAN